MNNQLRQLAVKLKELVNKSSVNVKTISKKLVKNTKRSFKQADKIQRALWSLAALLIVGSISYAVISKLSNLNATSSETVTTETADAEQVSEEEKVRLITAQAESREDGIYLTIGVHQQHRFKEIWANYSDDIKKLEQEPGRIDQTVELENKQQYQTHQVKIPLEKVKDGRRYYYQAVGETEDGEMYYGQIATFDTSP